MVEVADHIDAVDAHEAHLFDDTSQVLVTRVLVVGCNTVRGDDDGAATASVGVPDARYEPTAVWTGSSMIVYGGVLAGGAGYAATGGRYDPLANTWTATSTSGVSYS